MKKVRIYADMHSWIDGFGSDWYSRLSLEPFENNCLYKDFEDGIIDAGWDGKWKMYTGIESIHGSIINGEFYPSNAKVKPDGERTFGSLCKEYKEGKLINTYFKKRE